MRPRVGAMRVATAHLLRHRVERMRAFDDRFDLDRVVIDLADLHEREFSIANGVHLLVHILTRPLTRARARAVRS